jgi:hypothetical protein
MALLPRQLRLLEPKADGRFVREMRAPVRATKREERIFADVTIATIIDKCELRPQIPARWVSALIRQSESRNWKHMGSESFCPAPQIAQDHWDERNGRHVLE